MVISNQLCPVHHLWTDDYPILPFFVIMSSLSTLNDKISYLTNPNQLCPIYHLWTDRSLDLIFLDLVIPNRFLNLPSFNPQCIIIFDWLYHIFNLWIISVTFVISSKIQLGEFFTLLILSKNLYTKFSSTGTYLIYG